jgi:phosphoglucosamine mutase
MPRLFGTDGVRGVAGTELTPDLVLRIADSAARFFDKADKVLLVGRDTRISGPEIENQLARGFVGNGWKVINTGIIPTPGLARLCREMGYYGAVISASHNPIEYNGIKFFSPKGVKLLDEEEDAIESLLRNDPNGHDAVHGSHQTDEMWKKYALELIEDVNLDLSGKKIVLDCAYGATCLSAPFAFRQLGADIITIGDQPDGNLINVGCGSTEPELMCKTVRENGAWLGFAFDGDGDRCIACDHKGNLIDGDKMMGIISTYFKGNRLPGDIMITTVMTNMGLEEYLRQHGIKMGRANVGDRYVYQMMLETGANLGGEQSGHVIISDRTTTGDGTLTALTLAQALIGLNKTLKQAAEEIPTYPQILVNVKVRDKEEVLCSGIVEELTAQANKALEGHGRILIRPSGTEPKIRVMVEASSQQMCEKVVHDSADQIKTRFGI